MEIISEREVYSEHSKLLTALKQLDDSSEYKNLVDKIEEYISELNNVWKTQGSEQHISNFNAIYNSSALDVSKISELLSNIKNEGTVDISTYNSTVTLNNN